MATRSHDCALSEEAIDKPEMDADKLFMVYSKSPKRRCPMKATSSATSNTVYPTSRIHGITYTHILQQVLLKVRFNLAGYQKLVDFVMA